ncbi:DUF2515 family protein [Evansella sp. AB-P1]|uniref:DUF2515 family protein n=1 Tax=Evansella sp. AB-P1 TaxID=3037653 RepID=UPI00241C49FC|nr:DUF2515 family protein [Evansella sp. AB-P1]MDG5787550.1 DUF2515 family protein [Evansella sp. AB-P1]
MERKKTDILLQIKNETERLNRDNILRTKAYQEYYKRNPEITWSYLASMVSRNAGWSMADLWSKPYRQLLSDQNRKHLFITYERANWMIFSDAYPQLLLYEWSKKWKEPLFSLMSFYNVSSWMIEQWEKFWSKGNCTELLHSLIVNEQHLIQTPVIESPFFKKKVFHRFNYVLQERLHFSVVLFPTMSGELYGRSIKHFSKVSHRIDLGKKLAWILLESPVKNKIKEFYSKEEYTGSRRDYQKWQIGSFTKTPKLLPIYPFVMHEDKRTDWSKNPSFFPSKLLKKKTIPPKRYTLTSWYRMKQKQIKIAATIKSVIGKSQA